MRPTTRHHQFYFFPFAQKRVPQAVAPPASSHGFLLLKNWELFPGPPGVQPARHVFSPQGRGPYPVLPLPTRVICFRLRLLLTGLFSWVLCGDCTLCTIHAAFLVGLGEPRSRKSRNCCTTPTPIPHCNPRVFPFASEIGRHCIKNLASQLPSLGDQVSRSRWGRRTSALPLATAPSTCPVRAGPAPGTPAGAHRFPPRPTGGRWRWGAQCGPPPAPRPPPAAQGCTRLPTWRHRRPEQQQQQEQPREVADPAAAEPQAGHGLTLRRALAGHLSGSRRLGRPAACECRCRTLREEVEGAAPGTGRPESRIRFRFCFSPRRAGER